MVGMVVAAPRSARLASLREAVADRRCRLLALMFAISQALDALTTVEALRGRGLGEGNPLLATLMAGHLTISLLLKATVVVLVTAGAFVGLHRRRRHLVLRVCVLIGLVVVVSNVLTIARS